MFVSIILSILGLALVVFGADLLVEGATSIARKLKISEFIIGLTIVGFGTSCPELVVSTIGAIDGNSDIAIGNVLGSNIFNTLFILGLTAIIMPITITEQNRKRDIPIAVLVTVLFVLMGMNKTVFDIGSMNDFSCIEGIMLLLFFAIYLILCFNAKSENIEEGSQEKNRKPLVSILFVIGGLCGLIFGGQIFVDQAVILAKMLGVSDKIIAMTLLACGTSLPELATSIVAAAKKKGQLALGNILGSNVFNFLLIIGVSATIHPISLENVNLVDVAVLLSSMFAVWLAAHTFDKNKLDRKEGVFLVIMFFAYYTWLFIN